MLKEIDVRKIDPSPFQIRKQSDVAKLKELAASIEQDGLMKRKQKRGQVNYLIIYAQQSCIVACFFNLFPWKLHLR